MNELPDTSMLNFFNKVLISLVDLSPDGNPCSVKSLVKQCQTVVFGAHRGDYDLIMEQCHHCGLLSLKGNKVTLSYLGNNFLKANRDRYFEITEAQKNLIAERIIFNGAWSSHATRLFEHFAPDLDEGIYVMSTDEKSLPKEHNASLHLFKYLGIIIKEGYTITADKKYSELIYRLTADRKAISEQELEKMCPM